jgi:hypothetical protein
MMSPAALNYDTFSENVLVAIFSPHACLEARNCRQNSLRLHISKPATLMAPN